MGLLTDSNERFSYPVISLKKGNPIERSLPVKAIIGSTAPPPPSPGASTMVAEHSHQKILEDLCCDFEKKKIQGEKIRSYKNDEFENEKSVRTNGSLTVFSSLN